MQVTHSDITSILGFWGKGAEDKTLPAVPAGDASGAALAVESCCRMPRQYPHEAQVILLITTLHLPGDNSRLCSSIWPEGSAGRISSWVRRGAGSGRRALSRSVPPSASMCASNSLLHQHAEALCQPGRRRGLSSQQMQWKESSPHQNFCLDLQGQF